MAEAQGSFPILEILIHLFVSATDFSGIYTVIAVSCPITSVTRTSLMDAGGARVLQVERKIRTDFAVVGDIFFGATISFC